MYNFHMRRTLIMYLAMLLMVAAAGCHSSHGELSGTYNRTWDPNDPRLSSMPSDIKARVLHGRETISLNSNGSASLFFAGTGKTIEGTWRVEGANVVIRTNERGSELRLAVQNQGRSLMHGPEIFQKS